MKNLIYIISILVFFSGCTTKQYSIEKNSKIFKNDSKLIIFRENRFFGKGMKPLIILNDNVIGQSIAGTAFYVNLKSRNYEFYIPKMEIGATWIPIGTSVMATNMKTKYIKTKSLTFKSQNVPICIETSVSMNSFSGELDFEIVDCLKFKQMVNELEIIKFNDNEEIINKE